MKYFFIFLFLLPTVSAIAITPIQLDFGDINGSAIREIKVYNNLESGADYTISNDIYAEPQTSYLEPQQSTKFRIIIDSEHIPKTKELVIDEIKEDSSIINSIKIPLIFNIDKNQIQVINKAKATIEKSSNNTISNKTITSFEKEKNYEKISFYMLGGLIVLLFLICLIKKLEIFKYKPT
ncbi:MAG: hypothetical protein U9Q69_03350 [Nanoarchaeota archaeon]|nr:hypothetical protein [Nanoarchaeota archaeon]